MNISSEKLKKKNEWISKRKGLSLLSKFNRGLRIVKTQNSELWFHQGFQTIDNFHKILFSKKKSNDLNFELSRHSILKLFKET